MYGATHGAARLDELVVVHLLEALGDDVHLLGQYLDELAQHAALLVVADAVDRGKQPVDLVGCVEAGAAHAAASTLASHSRLTPVTVAATGHVPAMPRHERER